MIVETSWCTLYTVRWELYNCETQNLPGCLLKDAGTVFFSVIYKIMSSWNEKLFISLWFVIRSNNVKR